MGQVTALTRALAKAPCPQVDPSDGVPVNTRQIAEGAQRVKSAYQTFGPFSFHPARHLLLEGETLVRLGSRALEILAALVERPGELVSKDELTARVWPNTVVEESNLAASIGGRCVEVGVSPDKSPPISLCCRFSRCSRLREGCRLVGSDDRLSDTAMTRAAPDAEPGAKRRFTKIHEP